MRHALALAWTDVRVLYRTGYIWVTVAIFLVLLALALQVWRLDFEGAADVVAAVILTDVVATPALLVALMLLLERDDGCLVSLAVTPVKLRTFLTTRTVIVSVVCAAEMFFLVLIAYDGARSMALLGAGLLGAAAVAALGGVIIVAPFKSLQPFVLPMVGWIFALSAPAYGVFLGWDPLWLAWHPTAPAMALISAAFEPKGLGSIAYGFVGTAVWLGLASLLAARALKWMQLRAAGG